MLRLPLCALLVGAVALAVEPPKAIPPKFKTGKDTTVLDGPLTADGYIDYETALNDRLRGKIAPDANAVVGLVAALGPKPEDGELPADFWKALGIAAPPENGDYLVRHFRYFRDDIRGPDSQAFFDRETQLRAAPWKAADEPKFAEWLTVNEKPLAAAIAATQRKEYFHPFISRPKDGSAPMLMGALLPIPQTCREFASALSLRAMLRCGHGKFADAWADILAVHRLGRLVARGGSGIEMLVGVALGAIAHNSTVAYIAAAKPDAKTALACQADLLALPPWPKYADKLALAERFTALDALQSLRRGGPDEIVGGLPEMTAKEKEELLAKFDWEGMFRLNTKWYDRMEAALRKPTRTERQKAGAEIDRELQALLKENRRAADFAQRVQRAGNDAQVAAAVSEQIALTFLGLMVPAVAKLNDAADRAEQTVANGVLALALAAHVADHKKYPEKLAGLAPKYVAQVPDDLFSGKALIYKPTDTGYLLYSVGANGTDDGGRYFGDNPKGDDLTVRMSAK